MNRNIVYSEHSRRSGVTETDLAAPLGSGDVRLVADTSQGSGLKRSLKRKSFKINIMTKEAKANQKTRPARKIKLNRSIFNSGFQGTPVFRDVRVKTLDEIKSERKESKDTTTVSTQGNVNGTTTTTTTTVVSSPRTVTKNISVDTRKVLKVETTRKLLLPTIELTRISSGDYSRSVKKSTTSGNVRKIIRSEAALDRFKTSHGRGGTLQVKTDDTIDRSPQRSPAKKRRISPVRSPYSESAPLQQSLGDTWSTKFDALPRSLEKPPSPALSLGAQSDDELGGCELETKPDERVVINSADELKADHKQPTGRQKLLSRSSVSKSSVSPVKKWNNFHVVQVSSSSRVDTSFDDDKLDVMSIMADDDELFLDENPRPALKRSLSQDSVFNMSKDQDGRGDLRSLLKKTKDAESKVKNPVGDLISSKPLSQSFKIPLLHQNEGKLPHVRGPKSHHDNSAKGFYERPHRHSTGNFPSENPPKRNPLEGSYSGTASRKGFPHGQSQKSGAVPNMGCPGKGIPPPEHDLWLNRINISLQQRNVGEAWTWIRKLDQINCPIDRRLLEELLKVCERVSNLNPYPSPFLGDAALGAFEIIKKQGELNFKDFIMVILTLCRCQRDHEAFSYYKDMKASGKLPPVELMEPFVKDLCKALVLAPSKVVEVIHDVVAFPFDPERKVNIVNHCISVFISCRQSKLKEVNAEKWNSLVTLLSSPPSSNVQSASQIHTLMEQNGVPLSHGTLLLLLKLYQETNSTKLLLNLLSSKATRECLAVTKQKLPVDVEQFLLRPTVNTKEIETCFAGMIKEGTMPSEEHLQQFIKKAMLTEEYNVIYQLFLKCERSSLSLPMSVLKPMMEALENWDENTDASVQVYATLRQARKARKPSTATVEEPPKNSERLVNGGPKKRDCHTFMRTGSCRYGDKCYYSHANSGHRHRSSSHDSENSERDSSRESQNRKDGRVSPIELKPVVLNPGAGILNNMMLNGQPIVNPLIAAPFAALQAVSPAFPRIFNPQLFNKVCCNRPPLNPRFQRNLPNRMPRFGGASARNQPVVHGKPPLHVPNMSKNPAARVHSSNPRSSMDRPRVGRSFSWEPNSSVKPTLHNGEVHQKHMNPSTEKNNNGKVLPEMQLRIEMAVKSKEWQSVHAMYVECKTSSSNQQVRNKDLQLFRNAFVKDTSIGQNFAAFIEFLHKESSSGRSCHSNQSATDVLDEYDIEFVGALGVSLMERCLVLKQCDEGYEVLLALHSHNISYFQSGWNFGAYTKDIPPTNVALIAVKLCLGVAQHGALGALVVLKACNYALPEDGEILAPEDEEYRIRVLNQLFSQLFDKGHIPESHEIVQNLDASRSVTLSVYTKLLNHYVAQDDFDQSFVVLDEMREKGLECNGLICHSLYEKFLKHCIEEKKYDDAMAVVEEIETRKISINGEVLRNILNSLSSSAAEHETLARALFEKCNYPETFCNDTPWLCELRTDYSAIELKLLIQNHLKQVHQHLVSSSTRELVSVVKELEIVLYPQLPNGNAGLRFTDFQKTLSNISRIVERILLQDLNPPLAILQQSGKQFHRKVTVEKMSVYRWFNANIHSSQRSVDIPDELEALSQGSVESDVSE